nr:hypothetical protein [uncultured Kingella sp.]
MRQGGKPQGVQVVRQGEPTPYHCNFNRLYQGKGDRLRDADPVDAAKWWMLAATADKRYTRQAQKAVAALPAAKQQQVRSQVRSWLTTHTTVPKSFDWKKPVNDTLPPR